MSKDNDKIQQARREIFESWTKSEHGNLSRRQDGEYFDDLTHGAWLGFNAALDCVVIELPDVSAHYEHSKYMHGVRDSRAAIESTDLGLKTK